VFDTIVPETPLDPAAACRPVTGVIKFWGPETVP